jgi:phosphoribosylformylglycinamidine synthase
MATPRALVLTGYGINCDRETEFVFRTCGADARRVHVNDLIDGHDRLSDYQILAFPGGFSYGDDISSGRVLANKIKTHLADAVAEFVEKGGLVIGICNGFQVMVKYGLLGAPTGAGRHQASTLTHNDSSRYEDRWVHLGAEGDRCVFTRGIRRMYLPVAHGEGKFFADPETLDGLEESGCVVLRYGDKQGAPANGRFPWNPNGSMRDIAGICDPTGRVFGMMPHPERHIHFTNHPQWTRIKDQALREGTPLPAEGDGMRIFRNAVEYFG